MVVLQTTIQRKLPKLHSCLSILIQGAIVEESYGITIIYTLLKTALQPMTIVSFWEFPWFSLVCMEASRYVCRSHVWANTKPPCDVILNTVL